MSGSSTAVAPATRVGGGAGRRLLGLAGFAAGGLSLTLLYHQLGVGVPCPFLQLTGWWCPLCGATRMAASMLDGNLAAAFAWNPAVFIMLIGLGVVAVAWLIELFTRRPPPWRAIIQRYSFITWFVVVCGLAVLWTVGRNVGRILITG